MRFLVLCEGDAETRGSWSGSTKSVVDHLRSAGHDVTCRDADLYGIRKLIALLASFSPVRRRWWVKYHLGSLPFGLRTARAEVGSASERDAFDVVLQIGATFSVPRAGRALRVLYCDSNIALASHAENPTGADLQFLTPGERDAVRVREQRVYESVDVILTMSERLRRSFLEDFGIPADRVRTIHAGANLDLGRIVPRPSVDRAAPPTVLFVGRDFLRKGGPMLLRMFERVRARIPEARLILVGPPDLELRAPGVVNLGFLDKETPGGLRQLTDAYSSADVFCLPTRFEPFGIAFVEAMLHGVACVGPRSWAIPEIIDEGKTGFVVDPDDVEAFAERLIELLSDRERTYRMGQAGRDRARSHFTWEAVVDRMTRELESVAKRTGQAGPASTPRAPAR